MNTDQYADSKVVNLGSVAHQNSQDLLPWFVMGTLDDDDRTLVEEHLRGCAACQHEVQWQQQLRDANQVTLPERDVNRAFAALRARMPVRDRVQGRLKAAESIGWMQAALAWWRAQSAPVGWALALQSVLIVGLVSTLALRVGASDSSPTTSADTALFHALARPVAATPSARLVIAFAPQTSVAEMRRVLIASGTRIVDGPTAADAYILAVAPEHVEQAMQLLRAEHSVLLIQSLDAPEAH